MAALDTNVLVRYLVRDDPAQFAVARRLIHESLTQGLALFVPVTVFLELEWVLRSAFGFDKESIVHALSSLLSAQELRFESELALEVAVHSYREGHADLADALHVALAAQAGESPLWTFDKAASKLAAAQLLK